MEDQTALTILADPEIQKLHGEAIKLEDYAKKRIISSKDDLAPATNDLTIISRLKKAFEERRKEILTPLQKEIKEINAAFESITLPILSADNITRVKILEFQHKEEVRRQEQEKINALRMEAAQKEAALNNGEISESVNLVEVAPEVPKRVSTDMGSTGIMKIRKYEVVDFALLPDQYKIANTSLLNKVVKAGIPLIPGVKIYTEDTLRVTTK